MNAIRNSQNILAHPVMESKRGMCLGGHPLEAQAGAAMLEAGGNAVDAAVSACFMSFVVEQLDCSLGGFAHLSFWDQTRKRFKAYGGYVRAPKAAYDTMFVPLDSVGKSYYGHPSTRHNRAKYGPLAVAVPGAVSALCRAHQDHGRLHLKQVLGPAIEKAEDGVAFNWRDRLAIAGLREEIAKYGDTAAILLPQGRLPQVDVQFPQADRLDTTPLARTLKVIADKGERGFYSGKVAKTLSDYLQSQGGIFHLTDLENYRPKIAMETPGKYRNYEYITCFDGVGYEALNILSGFSMGEIRADSVEYRHLMAEALGMSFTDNIAFHGDTDFVKAPMAGLVSKSFARQRRECIQLMQALPRPMEAGNPWVFEPGNPPKALPQIGASHQLEGTSQMVAADREGNMVSITTAVGWDYGSLVYVPDLGIFMNNGMSFFDPRPNRPGSIAPGKMPMFGAPTLVLARDGHARFAAAGSGGYRIAAGVLHTMLNTLDFAMPVDEAVNHPRIHCQGDHTFVDSRISQEVVNGLKKRGHQIVILEEHVNSFHFGRVCALSIDPKNNVISGSASPHWLTGIAAL